MNIAVESIPKKDAIEEARNFLLYFEQQAALWDAGGRIEISLQRGPFERIAKVLLIGIGELSK